jgi:DNA-binding beta-propeller fold protein YncE
VAADGSVYVADANNHRIQHFSAQGEFLDEWGSFADASLGEAPGGTFFEPWSVAVSPDGRFVYVADTWNHRIQKFTANGQFVEMWGVFGQDTGDFSMWGPRDLVVDEAGNILVVDTGNKRIKVFDANGNFVSQFGEFGLGDGQFDEPVGIGYDPATDRVFVADTWNQRVQVLSYVDGVFQFQESWEISGWIGQSLTNKPYLTVGSDGRVYITDPEAGRVLVYNQDGTVAYFFGGYDQAAVEITIAQGIGAGQGVVWVTDSQNSRLLRFLTP